MDENKEMSILTKLDTVKAPPDFEQSVMARLALRRRGEVRRRAVLRLSLAGSFGALLAAFILLNTVVLHQKSPQLASASKNVSAPSGAISRGAAEQFVPVMETFDYATEVRSRSQEPQTVYLLEQVSDTTPQGITY